MNIDLDALELELVCTYLMTAPQAEWLVTALSMNYDGKSDLIRWMAEHPRLDRATALALYWYSQPGYFQQFATEADVPSVNRRGWGIVQTLQARLAAGQLIDAGLAFDPANDLASPTGDPKHPGHDWTAEALTAADQPAWLIPATLFDGANGDVVDVRAYAAEHGWEEGMPATVFAALEEAYEAQEED